MGGCMKLCTWVAAGSCAHKHLGAAHVGSSEQAHGQLQGASGQRPGLCTWEQEGAVHAGTSGERCT